MKHRTSLKGGKKTGCLGNSDLKNSLFGCEFLGFSFCFMHSGQSSAETSSLEGTDLRSLTTHFWQYPPLLQFNTNKQPPYIPMGPERWRVRLLFHTVSASHHPVMLICSLDVGGPKQAADLPFSTSLIGRYFGSLARVVVLRLNGKLISIPHPAEAGSVPIPPSLQPDNFSVVQWLVNLHHYLTSRRLKKVMATYLSITSRPSISRLDDMVRCSTSLYLVFPFSSLSSMGPGREVLLYLYLEKIMLH